MLKCVLRESREECFLIQEKSKAVEAAMGLVLQPTIEEFLLALR